MKEDILEQLVDNYLKFNGFFTAHNVKFKPAMTDAEYIKNKDSVASDIDVIGFHPMKAGIERVWVVGCKSWQDGFNPSQWIDAINNQKKLGGREAWKKFRELTVARWADGMISEVQRLTGSTQFTYVTAVTWLRGERSIWEQNHQFKEHLRGNPIKILTLQEMLSDLYGKTTTTVASSEVGRLLQVIRASGWKP